MAFPSNIMTSSKDKLNKKSAYVTKNSKNKFVINKFIFVTFIRMLLFANNLKRRLLV